MTMKFEIPFLVNLTEEQEVEIDDDIIERIQKLNKATRRTFGLVDYTISILVVVKEVVE